LPLDVFTQRNFVADFIQLKLNFIQNKKSLFKPPFVRLRDNDCTASIDAGKPVVVFLFIISEPFSLSLTVEML